MNLHLRFLPSLLFSLILFSSIASLHAQDYSWVLTLAKQHRSFPVAIRKDNIGNIYLATYTDSVSTHIYTQLDKLNADRQLLWQIQIDGNAAISDVELKEDNHAITTGYFEGTITVQGNSLNSIAGDNTGFIFETDEAGTLVWIHTLDPLGIRFEPVDLFIATNGYLYLTAEKGGTGAFCSFHKLDATGNIIKSEFPQSFENRSFSHIIADTAGNVYLSGTCGNMASFDNIPANPDYSYQNVLVKYDTAFNAEWLLSRRYITFDDNNRLCTDGKNLYWVYDDFPDNFDTVKIQKVDYNGQVLSTVQTPFPQVFFPAIDYSVDKSGNSVYLMQAGVQKYLYRYDSSFNITWQDTLNVQVSGFPLRNSLVCYDSSFYMLGIYLAPTLSINQFTLGNPNIGQNYASDVFAFKWGNLVVLRLTVTDFTAKQHDKTVLLQWNSGIETNTSRFIIERSSDGILFSDAGRVAAVHPNGGSYLFNDDIAAWPYQKIYYRLRQEDKDGKSSLSITICLSLHKPAHFTLLSDLQNDRLILQAKSEEKGSVMISFFDAGGRLLKRQVAGIIKGENTIDLSTDGFAAGSYILTVKGLYFDESLRFVVK